MTGGAERGAFHAKRRSGADLRPEEGEPATVGVILKGYPRLSETFIAQELHGLEQRGFRLRFFSMRFPTDKTTHPINAQIRAPVVYLPEYLHWEPLRVLRGLATVWRWPSFWPTVRLWLGDLRREPTPNRVRRFGQACVLAAEMPCDVGMIYAHFIHTPASVGRYASVLTGRPWSCSAHAKDIWTSPEWELREKLASAEWVATCTAVGHAHLQSLAEDPGRANLIYHGIDLERFPTPEPKVAQVRDGRERQDPVRLVSVGRAVEKKGLDTLLDALARVPGDVHWRLDHIGGGTLTKALKQQAERLGIVDRITWHGAQAQTFVLETYRASDLFVLPCRIASDGDRDGLPNLLVEAQSQGLACLSTPISAIPELIRDGESGILVPPDDPAALCDAIVRLCRDPGLRARLGAAGEARVRAEFDKDAGLEKLVALFPAELRASAPVQHASQAARHEAAE